MRLVYIAMLTSSQFDSPVAWSVEADGSTNSGVVDLGVEGAEQLAKNHDILAREGDAVVA